MFRQVVLSLVFTVASASPISFWANGFARPLATSWNAPLAAPQLASPLFNPHFTPAGPEPLVGASNYRGPLSLAPGQSANILAADGRPLDTQSVNLDRAVHYTARALEGGRRLQKRSISAAPLASAAGTLAAGPLVATPLTLGRSWVGPAPIAPVAISVAAPLGLRAEARVGNIW